MPIRMDTRGREFNTGGRNGSMTKMEEARMEWRGVIAQYGSLPGGCQGGPVETHSVR